MNKQTLMRNVKLGAVSLAASVGYALAYEAYVPNVQNALHTLPLTVAAVFILFGVVSPVMFGAAHKWLSSDEAKRNVEQFPYKDWFFYWF